MRKLRIAFGYLAYPFALASYFRHALEKREDIELFTFGPYTGDFIPWGSGMRLPMKYVKSLDLPLPESIKLPTWEMIKSKLLWQPDLVICCDAGFHLSTKPDVPYATILTDPHVLGEWYKVGNQHADYVFTMQQYYKRDGEILLPYCCSPDHHYPIGAQKDYDASLIGLHYQQRDALVQALRNKGYKVLYDLGLVYDEYREQNCRATIGLNWSSLMDINARIMESLAMRQVLLTNRLPHMDELGLTENEHYLAFSDISEAVEKADWILSHKSESMKIADKGHDKVHSCHTYEMRIAQILTEIGLL